MYVPIWEEDRKKLDSRRVGAIVVDGILLSPLLIPLNVFFEGLTAGAWLVYLALQLGYFHLCESIAGQTIGKRIFDLRVVRREDAGPASAKAISARTVLRIVDAVPGCYLVGALSMLLSDKRRQRLGDMAAGTVVTRASARPYTAARRSPLQTVYPGVWLGAAVAVVLVVGHGGDPGLADLDRICEKSESTAALITTLSATTPTTQKEYDAGLQLIRKKLVELQLEQAGDTGAAAALAKSHHRELASLGLEHC